MTDLKDTKFIKESQEEALRKVSHEVKILESAVASQRNTIISQTKVIRGLLGGTTSPETFGKMVERRIDECKRTLIAKGAEYSRNGDRLWNFRNAGRKRNQHPITALQGMMSKHEVSIDDICDQLMSKHEVPSQSQMDEKFNDIHNYYFLLEALIEEGRNNE